MTSQEIINHPLHDNDESKFEITVIKITSYDPKEKSGAKAAGPVVRARFYRSRLSSLTQRYLLLETKVDNSSVNGGRIRPSSLSRDRNLEFSSRFPVTTIPIRVQFTKIQLTSQFAHCQQRRLPDINRLAAQDSQLLFIQTRANNHFELRIFNSLRNFQEKLRNCWRAELKKINKKK
jgi:hypothetical protein